MATKIIETVIYTGQEGAPQIYFLKGLPASGKSSWAKDKLSSKEKIIRLSKDDYRPLFGAYSYDKEKMVLAATRSAGIKALELGFDIIIDDTNFSDKHFNAWLDVAKAFNNTMVQYYFDTPYKECIERDSHRGAASVGTKVIKDMYFKYIQSELHDNTIQYRDQDESLEKAILVDIDGTVALAKGRGLFEYSKVNADVPNKPIVDLIKTLHATGKYKIIFVSGREGTDDCADKTAQWLANTFSFPPTLVMRQQGDMRKDAIVKKELFEKFIKNLYNVHFVLDDRNQVVDMWRQELQLPCLQVNYGDF